MDSSKRPDNWEAIVESYKRKLWPRLAKELNQLLPSEQLVGAEINTIEEMYKKNSLHLEYLYFLVSDTPDGRTMGDILQAYFEKRNDLKLKNIDYKVIADLQNQDPKKFKSLGLRNLVREIGDYIRKHGGSETVAINATGGYKAQIAIAVVIGQSLNIPIYYMHETFSEIIDFPPLPVTLDYEILARNADLFIELDRNPLLTKEDLGEIDERIKVFLEEVEVDGKVCYAFNAIGQIYLESFRLRYPKLPKMIKAEKKVPTFGNDHHYPKGFKEFVEKVCREIDWMITAYTESYDGQKGIKGIGFRVDQQDEQYRLIGTYKSGDFGARFRIRVTDESLTGLTWAADQLNQLYKDNS